MVTTICVLSEDADTTTGQDRRTANECQGRIPRNLAKAKRESKREEGACGVGNVEIFICT